MIRASAEGTYPGMEQNLETWPERIWLQGGDEGGSTMQFEEAYGKELTWCQDQVNDGDVEYIRADLIPLANRR